MSKIGKDYGSEFHLRSALAERNQRFHEELLSVLQGANGKLQRTIEWLPNYHNLKNDAPETRGMDFLTKEEIEQWKGYWPDPKAGRDPDRHGIHNWDAVGRLLLDGHLAWLLVEAKAHVQEFNKSPACGAGTASKNKITKAFQRTRLVMGLSDSISDPVPQSWFSEGGYQITNRLASLNFLLSEVNPRLDAHLLFVYFINDKFPGAECPRSESEWRGHLVSKYRELGIPEHHRFYENVHYLFPNCRSHAST